MRAAVAALLVFLFSVGASASANAHGGGLDGLGCHHNRKAGGYHCHRGTLAGQSFLSKQEAVEALTGASRNAPQATPSTKRRCCKVCRKGVACGNSCISARYTCRQPPGCAC